MSDIEPIKAGSPVQLTKDLRFEGTDWRMTLPAGSWGVVVHDEYIEPPPTDKTPMVLRHWSRSVWVRFEMVTPLILEKSVLVSHLRVVLPLSDSGVSEEGSDVHSS